MKKFSGNGNSRSRDNKKTVNTSWDKVAPWYDDLLETGGDTYQTKVILPNLVRLLGDTKNKKILDLGCGQGFFSRAFANLGAEVTGVDISKELIVLAGKNSDGKAKFFVASADKLPFQEKFFNIVVCVLALQNIENFSGAVEEAARVLVPAGRFLIILNHPAFRIPKQSSWEFDSKQNIQYRRVDAYLSESRAEIIMNPGKGGDKKTLSFHRSLQVYFKVLAKNGFVVTRLEEWISNKESANGPKKEAEDRARKEFPLFLGLEAVLI